MPQSPTAMVGDLTLLVPMAGLIDVAAEIERLSKVLAKANQDLAKMRAQLSNESFVRNAPADVVAKDREREAELERTITEPQRPARAPAGTAGGNERRDGTAGGFAGAAVGDRYAGDGDSRQARSRSGCAWRVCWRAGTC